MCSWKSLNAIQILFISTLDIIAIACVEKFLSKTLNISTMEDDFL